MQDVSGTITTGGTAQILCQWSGVLDKPRRFFIQNLDSSEVLYVRLGTASQLATNGIGSIAVAANSLLDTEDFDVQLAGSGSGAISVFAATAGHKFTAGWC